jgi:cystathionine beta-synthase
VKLSRIAKGLQPSLLAKVEYLNPGGSVKDRIGIRMIEVAERQGLLKPGGTIVEPTSGNTGVGLVMAAAIKGYKTIFVMPDKMSNEKEMLLRAYGAEVIRTPTNVAPEDSRSYYSVAKKLAAEIPGAFSPNQYHNVQNPQAHYETTGPEIWRDTGGKLTHFVAGMGTGGTISGVARYLKGQNPEIKVVGADPEGSIYSGEFSRQKSQARPYKTEGIGEDFIPGTMDLRLIDEVITVPDKDAFLVSRRLAREEGLLVGGSSGAAVSAALKLASRLDSSESIVALLPDTGRNYLSTIFNDNWMKENGFL